MRALLITLLLSLPLHEALAQSPEERGLALASPTSLAVTLEALRRGEAMQSLGQCLAMEYRVAQRFLKHPDFVAGVGAVLSGGADSSQRRPRWAAAPTTDEVSAFFEPVEGGELQLE